MKARDVMTRRVLTIAPDATVLDAAKLMLKRRISGLPVVDQAGVLIGIVTEGDLLRRTETATEKHRPRWLEFILGPGRAAQEFTRSHGRKISEVMTPDPYSVAAEADLEDVVTLMEGHAIKRVPVVRQNKVIGIVSRANLMSALIRNARYGETITAQDRDICDRIHAEMERTSWAPTAMVEVNSDKGAVTLRGTILDDRDRAALKVLAENVPGVKTVRDNLIWVEPYSGIALSSDDAQKSRELVS